MFVHILRILIIAIFSFIHLYICSKSLNTSNNSRQNKAPLKSREVIPKLLKISVPITLSSAVMSLTNIIDLSLVMRRLADAGLTEVEASALYGNYTTLAVSMFNFAMSVVTPVSIIFLPHFTRSFVSRDTTSYRGFIESALRLVSFISAPMTFGLAFYSYEILALIFGADAASVGAPLLSLISPAVLFSSLLIIINTSLEASGKVNAPIYSMLLGGVVKIVVGYFLIADAKFGISGAPIGTVASYAAAFLVSSIILVKLTKRNLPIIKTVVPSYMIAGVSVSLSKMLFFVLKSLIGNSFPLLLSIALCALISLGFSALFNTFGREEKSLLAKYTNFA